MEGKRKEYPPEFKREAVKPMTEKGVSTSKASRDLGVEYSVLRRWKREYLRDGEQSFPGKGHLKSSDEEMRRHQREVDVLRMERDTCKTFGIEAGGLVTE